MPDEKCPELDEQRLVDLLSAATAPNRIDDREREAELGHKAAQALDVIRYLRRQLAQRDEQLAEKDTEIKRLGKFATETNWLVLRQQSEIGQLEAQLAALKAVVEQAIESMREAAAMLESGNIKIVAAGLEQVAEELREAAEQAKGEKGEDDADTN